MHTKNNILTFVKQRVLLVVALCMVFAVSYAQEVAGWEKFYNIGGTDELSSVIQTRDEGFLMTGYHTAQSPYIVKTNPDGRILWQQQYGQINPNGQFRDIIEVADGYVAIGWESTGSRDVLVVKINDAGEEVWANTFGGAEDDEGFSVTATSDGGIAVVGFTQDQFLEKQVYLLKIDADGTLLWEASYGNNYDDAGNGIIEDSDGNLVVAGYTELNVNVSVGLLLRVDADGTQELFNQVAGNVATDLVETVNGYVLSGYGNITGDFNAKLITTDINGNQQSNFSFGDPTFATEFRSITKTKDNGLVLAGFSETSPVEIEGYAVKTNLTGDVVEWEKTFGRANTPDFFTNVTTTFRNEFVMVGSHFENPLSSNSDFYIVKTNTEGEIFSNYIIGNVFHDLNNNCDFNPSDAPIEGWIIEAISDDHTCYGTSNANGSYTILVNTGSYTIQPRFPNDYWNSCIASQTVNFNAPFDTFDLDFATFVEQPCTDIELDMTTLGLTPGGTADYLITYCNNGTSTVLNTDLYVDVEFDDSYTINSASETFSVVGNVLRFQELNEIGPFDCGQIIINTTVDGVEGQTHSARAHAYPDEICATGGDGSHLEVDTECVGDEVNLTIRNTGTEAMAAASDFVIVEEMLLLKMPFGPLGPAQDTVIKMPATGATYRILAEQTAGHVGDSRPSEAIEGCVTGGGTFTTGIVNQLPEDDYDHFLSVDCQENQTTLNNESRGYPKGYDLEHYIQQCADLKYHHRFFYTGPDTAIRVVIRDTLSPFLDPASVRPGVSSHEYTMDVYGCGILSFTFENINLTGGSADPDESSIFVKYRVSQKLDNPVGSVVDNSAAAYFDYQSPIKTDSIFHTVASCALEDFIEIKVSTTEIHLDGVQAINVYPNPFVDEATVEVIADRDLEDLTFKLYDVSGRLLRNESFTGMTYQLYRSGLTSGMYMYKIESQGIPVSAGKLLVN